MQSLVREYLPHAPQHGLYVAPEIPRGKLQGALGDYAKGVHPNDVLALYDATRLGSAKDGVVFLADRLVYQNHDFQPPLTIHYRDVVRVQEKKQFLGGRKLDVDVNRGRATVTDTLDFSAHPEATEYVSRFLQQVLIAEVDAMLEQDAAPPEAPVAPEVSGPEPGTDLIAVRAALDKLHDLGRLTAADRDRMLDALVG
ncbi:MAG: hypothetical protein AAFP18_07475 [Bacteroidota bacterium]